MKIRIFILLLLSSSYYISQAQFLDNYFDYYRKMNLAELAIIDSAYYKALDYYQQGFLEVNLPMSKDLHNASICAVKTKKFDKAFLFFERLLQKGVKLDYFKSDIYKAIHKTKEWKLFEEEYPNKMKLAESRQNAELKSIITQMHGNDQELAKKKNETHDLRPKFHTEVKKNEASFIKIIKKYGFPNEDLIGIDSPSENKVMILLIHFMQIRSFEGGGNDSLSNYLYEAVKYGQLSPYSYAYIVNLDSKNTTNYGVLAIWGINNDHRGLRKFSSEEKKVINKNRELIGLECIEDYHKKVMYVYNYPDVNTEFKLHYSGAVGVMFFNDDSGEKIWTDALERGTYTPIPVKNPYDID